MTLFRSLLSCLVACTSLLAGCDDGAPCSPLHAVVTDIDETLTTADAEWFMQLLDEEYDPAMRPDANTLMQRYAEAGYTVVYITARGDELLLPDLTPARQATEEWLVAHGFPYEDGTLYLGEGSIITGDEAVAYKAGVIAELVADGWTVDYAYGNAETDIEAFLQAGIPNDRIFLVGQLAGTMDVEPLPDEEAFTQHLEDQLPTVPSVPCATD